MVNYSSIDDGVVFVTKKNKADCLRTYINNTIIFYQKRKEQSINESRQSIDLYIFILSCLPTRLDRHVKRVHNVFEIQGNLHIHQLGP